MPRILAAVLAAMLVAPVLVAPVHAQDVSGPLVLYTSQPSEDAQQTVDAFTRLHPGVQVEWFRDGTTQVMAKLAAEFEGGAPRPDVLLIADTVTMESLAADSRLMAYPEADVSAYDPAIMDPERMYFSTKLITTGIVYNTAAPLVPASYADLKDIPENTFAMPSPLTSGAAAIHMAAITGRDDLGWGFYEALAENGALAQGGNGGVLRAVAGGEKLYGFLVDYLAIRNQADGAPVAFVFPTEGVSAVTEPAAILSTAQNPAAAKAFIDFLLSPEGQQLASDQGYLPAHPAIAPPKGFPARDAIRLLDFDPAAALRDDAANKLKFSEFFGG